MKYIITESRPGKFVHARFSRPNGGTAWAASTAGGTVNVFVYGPAPRATRWCSEYHGPDAWPRAMDALASLLKAFGYEEYVERRLGPWIPAAESRCAKFNKGLVRDGDERTPYYALVSRPFNNRSVVGTVYTKKGDFSLEIARFADGDDDQAFNETFRRVQEALDAELRKDGFILED